MRRYYLFLFLTIFLSSCGSAQITSVNSVEADAISDITTETLEAMDKCLDDDDKEGCKRADSLMQKHPWLLTRDVSITNNNLMYQDEWDIQIKIILRNLDAIEARYGAFYVKKEKI